jgi:hypothetical protein
MLSTGNRDRPAACLAGCVPRRRVLAALAALPVTLALTACTRGRLDARSPGQQPTMSPPPTSTAPATPEPVVIDALAIKATAAEARALLAAYEATITAHASLGPVLAPYVADHDAHLSALAERISLPTPTVPATPTATTPVPSGSVGAPTAGPTLPGAPVPTDPAAARAALVLAERLASDAAKDAARHARDGEIARLLASISASRRVHAILLGAPA